MQTIQFDKAKALQVYRDADPEVKESLKSIFGDKYFLSVIDRIKTWEDACLEKGMDPVESLPFSNPFKTSRQEAVNAFFKLDVIAEVLREEVILDWTNYNQKKWYAWFNDYEPGAGFSFHVTDFGWAYSSTIGGARLCLDTSEKAEYFGKQFLPLFNKFLNPNN